MSSALAFAVDTELRLPEPLPNQRPILESAAARKVLRAGRRFSKSRCAMIAGIDGHGPVAYTDDGVRQPKFPGVLQGKDVVWVAMDYPNLKTTMWREEFIPRFKHLPFVDMNENDSRVSIDGLGTLFLRPETAINGIRGIGKRLGGVILDEAAFYDLESALRDVILPALLDNGGWLLLMSTTNDGEDGNAAKRVPSYFNLICEQIQRGERGPEWQEFYGTAYDNPRLSRANIDALVAEYPKGSASLKQEVFAELHAGGGRFYTLDKEVHLLPADRFPAEIPTWWESWGAFDWGYAHWAVFGLFVLDNDGQTYLVDSLWMRRQQDEDYALGVAAFCEDHGVDTRGMLIYAGRDCWHRATARGASGKTTAEVFAGHRLTLVQADDDRVNGGRALRRALEVKSGRSPLVLVDRPEKPGEHDTLGMAANRRVYQQLVDAVPDKSDVNKPAKVNANADGIGGDDGADMVRNAISTRQRAVREPEGPAINAFAPEVLAHMAEVSRKMTPQTPAQRKKDRRRLIDPMFGGY